MESKVENRLSDFGEIMNLFKDVNIDRTINTAESLSKNYYIEHFIMASILEAFVDKQESSISMNELFQHILPAIPENFVAELYPSELAKIIRKMALLGFIKAEKNGDSKLNHTLNITDEGVKAFQDYRFHTLATSSFFNYQTFKFSKETQSLNNETLNLNRSMIALSRTSIVISLVSILIATISLILAVIKM